MKDTALSDVHRQLGAKMVAFAGFNMPVQYEGINIEHETVRERVGVFDVSHMGQIIIKGSQALSLIQQVSTNDVSKLNDGKVQYSCLTNDMGGIIDDLLVYQLDKATYMLVVNAANIEKDFTWIKLKNTFDAEVDNISGKISLLAVQGPKALDTLQKLTAVNLSGIPYYGFRIATLAGISNVIISNTGYTGAGGFELYFSNEDATALWRHIFDAGKQYGIRPIGLGARDTLRLEMGYCLYGNDIDDSTSPLEAGLGWITKFGKTFTAKSVLERQKAGGLARCLVGLEMLEKGIPRHSYKIYSENRVHIGAVTSGTQSPTLKRAIGLGYIDSDFSAEGTVVLIEIRDKMCPAKICRPPFIKKQVE